VNVPLAFVLLSLIVFQALLGMWTVTLLLKPLIVTGHLLGGLTTFALLLWLWLSLRAHDRPVDGVSVLAGNRVVERGARARLWAGLALAAAGAAGVSRRVDQQQLTPPWRVRIFRAARTSGCRRRTTRMPSCCGAAWGSITRAACSTTRPRVAIHFTHRLGAVLATMLLLLAAHAAFRGLGPSPRWAGLAVLLALALQLSIGVFMVLRAFPLPIAAAHNAGAALLVAATVWLNRSLRPVADFR
jgi:cytochrome c oxidase assembly protein subunit 15